MGYMEDLQYYKDQLKQLKSEEKKALHNLIVQDVWIQEWMR